MQHDAAINFLNVNDHVIYRQDAPDTVRTSFRKFASCFLIRHVLQQKVWFQRLQQLREPIKLWSVPANELIALGDPVSRFCLLVRKLRTLRTIWEA